MGHRGRTLVSPRERTLELPCKSKQGRFISVSTGEEDTDRQPAVVPVERHGHRRVSGQVGDRVPGVEGQVVLPPRVGAAVRLVEKTPWQGWGPPGGGEARTGFV